MENLIGQKFNKLTVMNYVGLTGGGQKKKYGVHKGYHTWHCKCECGKEIDVREVKLKSGYTKSCGCLRGHFLKTHQPSWTLPKGEAARNTLLCAYRKNAKTRGLTFELSKEEFTKLTSSDCHYCGSAPDKSALGRHTGNQPQRTLNGDYLYNGIDRLNNDEGYTAHNCVSCCWDCNSMKSTRTVEEFLAHIHKICERMDFKK